VDYPSLFAKFFWSELVACCLAWIVTFVSYVNLAKQTGDVKRLVLEYRQNLFLKSRLGLRRKIGKLAFIETAQHSVQRVDFDMHLGYL
jgi:hypothetical protein